MLQHIKTIVNLLLYVYLPVSSCVCKLCHQTFINRPCILYLLQLQKQETSIHLLFDKTPNQEYFPNDLSIILRDKRITNVSLPKKSILASISVNMNCCFNLTTSIQHAVSLVYGCKSAKWMRSPSGMFQIPQNSNAVIAHHQCQNWHSLKPN